MEMHDRLSWAVCRSNGGLAPMYGWWLETPMHLRAGALRAAEDALAKWCLPKSLDRGPSAL